MISLGVGEINLTVGAGLVVTVVVPPVQPVTLGTAPLPDPGPFNNAPPTPPIPATAPTTPLAVTGSNSNLLVTLAIAMMAAGGTLLIGARRERDLY